MAAEVVAVTFDAELKMAGTRDRQKRRESYSGIRSMTQDAPTPNSESGRHVPSDAMDAPTPDPETRLLERSLQPPQRIIAAHGHADIHFGQIRNGSQQHDMVQRLTLMVLQHLGGRRICQTAG